MEEEIQFKQKVANYFREVISDKVFALQQLLKDLIESTRNETKSSAGDKYETARAMLQIEQDNCRKQLKEALEQKAVFDNTNIKDSYSAIAKGSLVKTDRGCFFVSVALGKALVDGVTIIALSPQSPLGAKFMGLKSGDTVSMNGTQYLIQGIV